MQNALLRTLSSWPGREATQEAFEARGFKVHRSWQQKMMEFCGNSKTEELNRYWNEVARETVACAGKCDPNARNFLINDGYRSSYLDRLAERRSFASSAHKSPPLLECLFEYNQMAYRDHEFAMNESALFERLKQHEAHSLAINPEGWHDRKRDVVPFAAAFGAAMGFALRRNRFIKKANSGLVFEYAIDLGGRPVCTRVLPLEFKIYHPSEQGFAYETRSFNNIIPGFSKYAYCESPHSYVLGIRAHLELFKVLLDEF